MTLIFDWPLVDIARGENPAAWPQTARIDTIDLGGAAWCIRQTRRRFWPSVARGDHYVDSALWLVARAGARWVAAPVFWFRSGQVCSPFWHPDPVAGWFTAPEGDVEGFAVELQINPGDLVGVFVSSVGPPDPRPGAEPGERTSVAFFAWPAEAAGPTLPIVAVEGDPAILPAVEPEPTPAPVAPPAPQVAALSASASEDLCAVDLRVAALERQVAALQGAHRALVDRIQAGALAFGGVAEPDPQA